MGASRPVVVKVGGSLYDLPDLGPRLRAWLATLGDSPVLLVPGGGAAADVVRELDRRHRLGDARAHALALRAVQLNAHFLAGLLDAPLLVAPSDRDQLWRRSRALVLDAVGFAEADEAACPGLALPHSWDVTSDAIAARVAEALGAERLVLLKSVTIAPGVGWGEAAQRGWVDPVFPAVVKRANLRVEAINLRQWASGTGC